MDAFWLILRILCMIGCVYSLWVIALSRAKGWDSWNKKTKYHWYSYAGWVFFGFYGTLENTLQDNQGGSRVIVLALVVALTVRSVSVRQELRADGGLLRRDQSE